MNVIFNRYLMVRLLYLAFPLFAALLLASCGRGHYVCAEFVPVVRTNPDKAGEYFNLGTAYTILERDEEAAEAFGEAVRLDPDDAGSYFGLGYSLNVLGRDGESGQAFKRALELGEAGAPHFKMGLAFFLAERYEDAVKELEQALEENDPHPVSSCFRLGIAYTNLGRFSDGLDAFKRALAMNQDLAANFYNVYFYAGLNLQSLGEPDMALAAYRESASRFPDFPFVHMNMGIVYADKGDLASARAEYDKLLTQDADLAEKLASYLSSKTAKEGAR